MNEDQEDRVDDNAVDDSEAEEVFRQLYQILHEADPNITFLTTVICGDIDRLQDIDGSLRSILAHFTLMEDFNDWCMFKRLTDDANQGSDEDGNDMQTFTDLYYGKGRFDRLKKLG